MLSLSKNFITRNMNIKKFIYLLIHCRKIQLNDEGGKFSNILEKCFIQQIWYTLLFVIKKKRLQSEKAHLYGNPLGPFIFYRFVMGLFSISNSFSKSNSSCSIWNSIRLLLQIRFRYRIRFQHRIRFHYRIHFRYRVPFQYRTPFRNRILFRY